MKLRTVHYCATELKPRSTARKQFSKSVSLENVIYLFFRDNECLYIGETRVSLANRIFVNTPKEASSPWYKEANTIQLIQFDDAVDDIARQTLESALILAYRPKYVKKA